AVPAPWPVHSPWLWGVRDTPNTPRRADDLNVTAGAAHSLAARPSTLAGSLSLVRREGLAPSRPFRGPGSAATRLCKPHTSHQESGSFPRLLRPAGSSIARHLPSQ